VEQAVKKTSNMQKISKERRDCVFMDTILGAFMMQNYQFSMDNTVIL
jgi:hypothetical protein